MQMWTILATAAVLVAMSAMVPVLTPKRLKTSSPPDRTVALSAVGLRTTCGATVSSMKWASVEEVLESEDGFLFGRRQRYTMLPKRVLNENQVQEVRDFIASSRNQPALANEPLKMYRQLFGASELQQTWQFNLTQNDLVAATRNHMLPIDERTFNHRVIESTLGKPKLWPVFVIAVIVLFALLLIVSSLPRGAPSQQTVVGIVLVAIPFVMMLIAAKWLRWNAGRKMPLLQEEGYFLRLFAGGWAIGNEDLVTFHGWSRATDFFLSRFFIGIRSDHGLTNIVPIRAFMDGTDKLGVYNFLAQAIELRQDWLKKQYSRATKPQQSAPPAPNRHADSSAEINPYRTPRP